MIYVNIFTNRKNDFEKHCLSKKHKSRDKSMPINNLKNYVLQHSDQVRHFLEKKLDEEKEKTFKCQYCSQNFKRLDGLTKHTSRCPYVLKENVSLKQKTNQYKKENEDLKEQVAYYKDLLSQSVKGGVTNNIMIMVNNHFPDAMTLEAPQENELRIFGLDHPKKLSSTFKIDLIEEANNFLKDSKGPKEDKFYYDKMTSEYGKGRDKRNDQINREKCKNCLATYIAGGIRLLYKKRDPKEQAFWSTDVSRYNFIIKDKRWEDDKNGEKLKEKLVSTILQDLKQCLIRQLQVETQKSLDYAGENNLGLTAYDYRQIIRDIPRASYIIEDIETGTLGDLIIKKTAKHFKVDKELLLGLEGSVKSKSVSKKLRHGKLKPKFINVSDFDD